MTTTLFALLLGLPVLGALVSALAGRVSPDGARWAALTSMMAGFVVSLIMAVEAASAPLVLNVSWIESFGVRLHLVMDGFATVMILLTTFIGVIAVLISWKEITERVAAFHVWVQLLQVGILIVFIARDLMLFYFGWELMLIPMYFIVGVWGHENRLYAAFKFFLFTFTGSVFMLVAMLYVYYQHALQTGAYTFDLAALMTTQLTTREQFWVFLGLFVGFAVKVPLIPFHTWLPDAHTQAPTAGSLILAGLLLKTGVYGLIRIANPIAPEGAAALTSLIVVVSVFAIFYGAICAFAQSDFKRLVAYSSISHLGFVMLGVYVFNDLGLKGAVLQMVNHGLATGGLFLIGGMLYERIHTRNFDMMGGLWERIPILGGFLLFFAMASLGLPGTGNFVGELYVIAGAFASHWLLGTLALCGVLFAAVYSLRVFQSSMHGSRSPLIDKCHDCGLREVAALGSVSVILVAIGFFPALVTAPLSWETSGPSLKASMLVHHSPPQESADFAMIAPISFSSELPATEAAR